MLPGEARGSRRAGRAAGQRSLPRRGSSPWREPRGRALQPARFSFVPVRRPEEEEEGALLAVESGAAAAGARPGSRSPASGPPRSALCLGDGGKGPRLAVPAASLLGAGAAGPGAFPRRRRGLSRAARQRARPALPGPSWG